MILGHTKGFFAAPAVFSSFTHVSVSLIMAKFGIKCMFFTFFRLKKYKMSTNSIYHFNFDRFYDNFYFLPYLVEHIRTIYQRQNLFKIL